MNKKEKGEKKCERCWFFPKDAIGYIELKWVGTERFYVCGKHKETEIAKNKEQSFKNPTFTPNLTFKELSNV